MILFNKDQVIRANDSHQLIDEESDEDSQLILPNATDDDTIDPQTLQFTLDPQTQQMLHGEQVVVFEVVQLNNTADGSGTDTQSSFASLDQSGQLLDQTPKIPKNIGKSGKTTIRSATVLTHNGASTSTGKKIKFYPY